MTRIYLLFNLSTLLTFLLLASCNNKRLDLRIIENEEILVEKYTVSEITTSHEFIDVTNKRYGKVERILEANEGSVDSVFIMGDTLFLKMNSKKPLIYDLASIKFGYKVILLDPVQ